MFIIFEKKFLATILFLVVLIVFTLSSAKEVYLQTYTSADAPVVLIDPGHGGEDGGATGISGALEKDINLAVAKYLAYYLEKEGISFIMTRDSDISIHDDSCSTIREKKRSDLNKRREIIQSCGAKLFVSIHMNSFTDSVYKGAQVFYSTNNPNSKAFAQTLKNSLLDTLKDNNKREIKKANDSIYIMKYTNMPAILVECGFLTNAEEEALLKTKAYQKKIAKAICNTIITTLKDE
ncbi:MAG: N-acetylmuramoyl-L-alanine amidase [Eubacteriales bacterium]|nr:N-acetylmuramoyl-L-alanine amidase [Eubacteriales bacterium]